MAPGGPGAGGRSGDNNAGPRAASMGCGESEHGSTDNSAGSALAAGVRVVLGAASVVAAGPGRGGGAGSGAAAGEQGVRAAGGGHGGEAEAAGGQRGERQGRQGSRVSAGEGSHEQRPGDIAGASPQADELGK